jgi:hypothetical protein
MTKFRLPRKIKKKIKGVFFYPMDEKTKTYLMANPKENQEDYNSYVNGELFDMLSEIKSKYNKKNG